MRETRGPPLGFLCRRELVADGHGRTGTGCKSYCRHAGLRTWPAPSSAIHAHPGPGRTVDQLAGQSNLSRSRFSEGPPNERGITVDVPDTGPPRRIRKAAARHFNRGRSDLTDVRLQVAVVCVCANRNTPRRGRDRSRCGGRERSDRVLRHPARRRRARGRRARSGARSTRSPTLCATWRRQRTATTRSSTHWRAMLQSSVIACGSTRR